MKILVLGGNRFMGKEVCKRIVSTSIPPHLTIFNRSGTSPTDKAAVIQGDRNNIADLKLIDWESVDVVVDMCLYKLDQFELILPMIKDKKYIFISSIAALDNMSFLGEYGKQKRLIEEVLIKEKSRNRIIIRPSYVLSSPGVVSHHVRDQYYLDCLFNNEHIEVDGNGDAKLGFVFASDVVDRIYFFIFNTEEVCSELNLSTEPITLMNLIKIFEDTTNIRARLYKNMRGPFLNINCFFPVEYNPIAVTSLKKGIELLVTEYEKTTSS
jgi:nucleoside-diphosphate-sugar epimerase